MTFIIIDPPAWVVQSRSMLAHRLRRWPNSKPTSGHRLVFDTPYQQSLKCRIFRCLLFGGEIIYSFVKKLLFHTCM